ncbi:hypothetical protein FRX31_019038 [Thalictrum thalictroides]|uniref:Uncharacterized protein n=1 Tax=Thalictrum thalictroides TaxID=46969 RepID=A0A7J6W354_THATH|nr:hypothetical protein FRX31_019038 [Thalictrum thalictroides]
MSQLSSNLIGIFRMQTGPKKMLALCVTNDESDVVVDAVALDGLHTSKNNSFVSNNKLAGIL